MPIKLERKLPNGLHLRTNAGNYKIEIVNVNYLTLYDFAWHVNAFETDLTAVIEAWRESKIEIEVCVMHNVIDDNRLYFEHVRVMATKY